MPARPRAVVTTVAAACLLTGPLTGCGPEPTAATGPAVEAPRPALWRADVPPPLVPARRPAAAGAPAQTRPPTTAAARSAASTSTAAPGPRHGPCPPLLSQRSAVRLDASTGTGTLVVSWWHGDPAAVTYWVGVQPQVWVTGSGDTAVTRPPITWTRVPPATACTTMQRRVPGLRAGVDHSVWLEAEATTPETTPTVVRIGVGRVSGVRLP